MVIYTYFYSVNLKVPAKIAAVDKISNVRRHVFFISYRIIGIESVTELK